MLGKYVYGTPTKRPVTKRPVTGRPIRTFSYRTSRLPNVQFTNCPAQNVQLLNNPVTKRPVTGRPDYQTSNLPTAQITRRPDYKTSSYIVYQPDLIRLHLLSLYDMHSKKNVIDFPVPSRDVTYQTLPGRE